MIWRESSNDALRIYTTTIPTPHRLYTLMHDRQYRVAIVSQQTGYNQPPHPGFFLGDGMAAPPAPNIVTSLLTLLGPPAPVFTAVSEDTGTSAGDFVTRDSTLSLSGTATPGTTVTVTRFGVGPIGTATVDAAGSWTLDYTGTTLPEGVSTFVAAATDADRDDRSALGAIRRHRGHDRAGSADHRDGGRRAGPGVARHGGSRRRDHGDADRQRHGRHRRRPTPRAGGP